MSGTVPRSKSDSEVTGADPISGTHDPKRGNVLTLMLLRHAKSAWDEPGLRDIERPLNARGRGAAPLMGQYLAHNDLLPDLTLCSTAVRTRQTLALVQAEWPTPSPVEFSAQLYETPASALQRTIAAERPGPLERLLLIGHNDGLSDFACYLAARGPHGPQRDALLAKFPTAALAIFDCAISRWADLTPDNAVLRTFVTPRQLAARNNDDSA
ncbi:MAG: histidine phosphatase family protein [Pseudomonadota bacterium]